MSLSPVEFPELVIGIAGPIGVDIEAITACLRSILKEMEYQTQEIKLTEAMRAFPVEIAEPSPADFFRTMAYKMDYANEIRKKYKTPEIMANIGIREIQNTRRALNNNLGKKPDSILERTAYLVRQFKTPAEIELLRRVYGRQFILVSAYGSEAERRKRIETRIRGGLRLTVSDSEVAEKVQTLISRDQSEGTARYGQQLRDTFHLADVFVDGINRQEMDRKIRRFINALFGRNDISPSKEEYGMYAAKSASLRSADLSRQVGAAIISDDGDIISQGCNEVPKAFGGTYWDSEEPDHRDIQIQLDPNDFHKKELLRDILERLDQTGYLSDKAPGPESFTLLVDALLRKAPDGEEDGALVGAEVMDVTEYGRVVHAEMCAICDAARTGRSVKDSILYCTTFPCHNCTKHILSAGIRKVVYMEPYPKSKARELHGNEIALEEEIPGRVSFVPFLGISPFRYRDIFQKGRRKNRDGTAARWYSGKPRPQIDFLVPTTADSESFAIMVLLGDMTAPVDKIDPITNPGPSPAD